MKLTCNKQSALSITRYIRSTGMSGKGMRRVDIIGPDISPRKHWTKSLATLSAFGLDEQLDANDILHIAVTDSALRPSTPHVHATKYSTNLGIPSKSFIEVFPGLAISSPELLFLEMAEILDLPQLIMLGHELCGSFSRDHKDPLNGNVTLRVKALTTHAKLCDYARKVKYFRGSVTARRALGLLADNAWSPTESLVATMASLPFGEFGYELGPCVLNERVHASEWLKESTSVDNRVPDYLIAGTSVGLNYDGTVHLDLNAIVDAAMALGRNPERASTETNLNRIVHEVRAKAVDDIRRNRELAAAGYVVFPVVKEDLYEEGGLDRVMMQVIEALERYEGRDMSDHRRMMQNKFLRAKRQELIWSLLAGKHLKHVSNRKEALPYLYGESKVNEVMVGF